MHITRLFYFLILLVFPPFILAQSEDEGAKNRQQPQSLLLEQILADIPNLKSGENRAIVFTKAGNLVWKADQKRARTMFQNAIDELINALVLAEKKPKSENQKQTLHSLQSTRHQLLRTIASRDAAFALEGLFRSRPDAATKSLALSEKKDLRIRDSSELFVYIAQQEIAFEQAFISQAADQNPRNAIELLKEALKRQTGETLNLLKKLNDKNAEAASEIADQIVAKLLSKSFFIDNRPDTHSIGLASSFLEEYIQFKNGKEKALKFNESQIKSLTGKLVSFFLEHAVRYSNFHFRHIVEIAESLAPDAVPQLRIIGKVLPRRLTHQETEADALLSIHSKPEERLSAVKELPASQQREVYETVVKQYVEAGDFASAETVLKANFSGDLLDHSVSDLKWHQINSLVESGRFAEAERIIDELPEDSQSPALIQLGQSIYEKDPVKNKSYVIALLEKYRTKLPERVETNNQITEIMKLASVYAAIEPPQSFRLVEPLIPVLNELIDASALLNGFQNGSVVRLGEMLISDGHPLAPFADNSILRELAASDLESTLNLINSFSRREIRLSLKLQLAESLLR
ncbi:MAG: hypothetical protein WKF92_15820 [Pyrinomonadaceae bacterium]